MDYDMKELTEIAEARRRRIEELEAEQEAAVAAEREANAMIADEWYSLMEKHGLKHHEDSENRSRCFAKARQAMYIAQDIRARADTDALAARDARVKAEALREAANKPEIMELCEGWCASGGLGCFSDCLACLINSAILDQNKESAND